MVKKHTKSNISPPKEFFPPVVAVLGHVDHGKTSLLDAIRKTDIAQGEHGGITQAIGASKIEFLHEGTKKQITFIDTPGHEAFAKMRGRGIQAADIGLLVVSSVDGVMPQTKESINLLKDTKIPFIVVLTKSDLPNINKELVKQQLLKAGVIIEESGGDIPIIEVSSKKNKNIKELLELILLLLEVKGEKPSPLDEPFKAIVIESKLDPKKGPVATIVIKNGTLAQRDNVYSEGKISRVKNITNDKGEHLKKAFPGDAVEILGFDKALNIGGVVLKSPPIINSNEKQVTPPTSPNLSADKIQNTEEKPILSIILYADTLGSLEAIINALPKEITIASQKTGDISPSDILFAKSISAIILGFNIKINSETSRLATQERVIIKSYNLIYELIDEITDVLRGKEIEIEEKIFGKGKVLASFPFEKTKALGIAVLEGRIARGDKVALMRKDEVIGESKIASMRVGKSPVSKVEKGAEAGVIISPFLDFTIGDMLICHG